MKPKVILIIAIVIILLAGLIYLINTGEQRAENKLRKENPTFHTVPEGGACRDGMGDCQGGLTCGGKGICVKP